MKKENQTVSRAVSRIIGVLRTFADGEAAISIKQLADELDLPPSTTHRLLDQLVELNLIERTPQRRYRIGLEFFRMGCRVGTRFKLLEFARPIMRELSEQIEETCSLSVYAPSNRERLVMAVTEAPASRHGPVLLEPCRALPLLEDAAGRAVLAHLSTPEVRQAYMDALAQPRPDREFPDFESLLEELATIRANGHAVFGAPASPSTTLDIAVPFFDSKHRVQGALSILMPAGRPENALAHKAARLTASARQLSLMLSGMQGLPTPTGNHVTTAPDKAVRAA